MCLSACLLAYLENHTATAERHQIFVHVAYICGRVFFWHRCDKLCTSGFVDDVMYSHNGPYGASSVLVKRREDSEAGKATASIQTEFCYTIKPRIVDCALVRCVLSMTALCEPVGSLGPKKADIDLSANIYKPRKNSMFSVGQGRPAFLRFHL